MNGQLKQSIAEGKHIFGTFMTTDSVKNAEILGAAGLDYVMIDCEHGTMDLETAGAMVSAIKASGSPALIRAAWNDPVIIKQTLDTGIDGIMIPAIRNREEAEQAILSCLYPPKGIRGVGCGRAVMYGCGGGEPDYYERADEDLIRIIQIENKDALDNIDEILSVEGIDAAMVGPFDLSFSLGMPQAFDNETFIGILRGVVEACERHHVCPAIFIGPDRLQKYMALGFRLILCGVDAGILYSGAQELHKLFKNSLG